MILTEREREREKEGELKAREENERESREKLSLIYKRASLNEETLIVSDTSLSFTFPRNI